MIAFAFQIDQLAPQRVTDAADRTTFKNLGHAAARIRKSAVESIKPAEGPSPVGSPPHTHTQGVTKKGKIRRGELQRAIQFDVDKGRQEAIVGPRASVVGLSGRAHELGEEHMGQDFPERPFMFPALEENLDRFQADWAGSIG